MDEYVNMKLTALLIKLEQAKLLLLSYRTKDKGCSESDMPSRTWRPTRETSDLPWEPQARRQTQNRKTPQESPYYVSIKNKLSGPLTTTDYNRSRTDYDSCFVFTRWLLPQPGWDYWNCRDAALLLSQCKKKPWHVERCQSEQVSLNEAVFSLSGTTILPETWDSGLPSWHPTYSTDSWDMACQTPQDHGCLSDGQTCSTYVIINVWSRKWKYIEISAYY